VKLLTEDSAASAQLRARLADGPDLMESAPESLDDKIIEAGRAGQLAGDFGRRNLLRTPSKKNSCRPRVLFRLQSSLLSMSIPKCRTSPPGDKR
jgi:hypothetical protein